MKMRTLEMESFILDRWNQSQNKVEVLSPPVISRIMQDLVICNHTKGPVDGIEYLKVSP